MTKRILLVLALMTAALATTMAQTRYCLSYEDFKNDKWINLEDSVWMEGRTKSQKFWSGGKFKHKKLHIRHGFYCCMVQTENVRIAV